jgi:geranylgeranyl diphosphate synthase type I
MMRLAHNDVSEEAVLEAMRSLDSTCLTLCEGQYLDLTFQDQLMVSSTDYFAMVDRKSGSLAECSAKLGAVINGMDADITSAFGGFGKNLGMAWQIKQDMDDLWGKSGDGLTPNNLLNKKKSLPIIYALESGSTSIKREIGSIYMKRVLEPSDISRVLELLNEVDAKTYAVGEVATRVKLAKEQVMATGISGENLDDFIDNVIGLE